MTYEEKIPEFALQPARSADGTTAETPIPQASDDGFDPTPYDRLLVPAEPGTESADASNTASRSLGGLAEQTRQESQIERRNQETEARKFPENPSAMPPTGSQGNPSAATERESQGNVDTVAEPQENGTNIGKNAQTAQATQTAQGGQAIQPDQSSQPVQVSLQPGGHDEAKASRDAQDGAKTGETAIEPIVLEQEGSAAKPASPVPDMVKMMPLENGAVYNELKIKTAVQKLETSVPVEEDILVPDVKPDLINILSMEGKAILSSKELQIGQNDEDSVRITGEVSLQTIYLPETNKEGTISIIQSRLPFKTDWQTGASPMSSLAMTARVETIDYSIINERKFRAKVTVALTLTEYAQREMQLFDSIRGEELQLLKETVKMSHVALRKEDTIDISEDLKLKEGSPKPTKILKSDLRIVENHKQATSEKMVINANVMASVLYIGEEEQDGETVSRPVYFQGKTDFTQFILMEKEQNIAMCKVIFSPEDLELKINESEDGFSLKGSVNTTVEVLTNLEKEVVADLYHHAKDTTYDSTENKIEAVVGTGMTEASAREIFNVPESDGQVGKVIYINGTIKETKSAVERGRVMVEGVLEGQIICLPESEEKKAFAMKQDIPFRGAMDVPSAQETMKAESRVEIKELWFDKINGKQVEVNASLQIESAIIEEKSLKLIKNPCFVENSQTKRPSSMVVYVTRKNDNLWKIAKRYKVSMDTIKEVNQLEEGAALSEGMRLLVVK